MAWMDENGLLYFWNKIKATFATQKTLASEIKALSDSMGELGYGDMMKATYDSNNNGIVDNAEKVNGYTVGVNVPADAKFTDTVYTHPTYETKSAGANGENTAPSFGGAFKVPAVANDNKGHVKILKDMEITIPNTEATPETAGLMSPTDKVKVDGIPDDPKYTDTVYEHPTYQARSGYPTDAVEPSFGGTFSVHVINSDETGHITNVVSKQVTLPNNTATVGVRGLMSSSDKKKLDNLPDNSTLESTYAKKADITGVYKYKGSVADESKLPTSGVETGWVYDIQSASQYGGAGANVAWNGSSWDSLGEVFTITAITNAEIDTICV